MRDICLESFQVVNENKVTEKFKEIIEKIVSRLKIVVQNFLNMIDDLKDQKIKEKLALVDKFGVEYGDEKIKLKDTLPFEIKEYAVGDYINDAMETGIFPNVDKKLRDTVNKVLEFRPNDTVEMSIKDATDKDSDTSFSSSSLGGYFSGNESIRSCKTMISLCESYIKKIKNGKFANTAGKGESDTKDIIDVFKAYILFKLSEINCIRNCMTVLNYEVKHLKKDKPQNTKVST